MTNNYLVHKQGNGMLVLTPTLEKSTDEYDDTEMSVPFSSVAFSSSITHGRDLSQY
jgi:hypothetical protein